MDDIIGWLREREFANDQLVDHRIVPGRDGSHASIELDHRLEVTLQNCGIDRLYRHQVETIEAVRDGRNVVLATPTASGKSLAYTVPAFERAIDHGGRTLYLAPQNALIADQEATLSELATDLGFGSRVSVRQYTGRLDANEKRAVRDRRPTVLLSTPDMLHYGLLPHAHRLWDWFFEGLETVVIDEVHDYRGVFGSHVALVLRRLSRMCERFESDPQFVCCSATIGNPVAHASAVTGRPATSFELVERDTSATGPTHWVFWNPPELDVPSDHGRRRSHHVETMHLFADLVTEGYQTLAFTRARQTAERYATMSADRLRELGAGDLAPRVAAYEGALGRDRRAEIEAGLGDGSIPGVWSTNALELGVDVGGLDVVLLDGYPGTRTATHQRAGRAGRGTDPSLVVLIAGEDQLDQYLMGDPDAFFDGEPEHAVVNPANDQLLGPHVRSAARENWLRPDDDRHFGPDFPAVVANLDSTGVLERRETEAGTRWLYRGGDSPHHEMSLRSIDDESITLVHRARGETIATLSFGDALRDAHPGAIYHHQGQSYEVVDLDLAARRAELAPTWADYYTRTLHEKRMTVERDIESKPLTGRSDVDVTFAAVTMRKQITGFERKDGRTGRTLSREPLTLPETALSTRALYFTIPPDEQVRLEGDGDFPGGIHAAEHGMISLFPLEVLCDRADVGGISTPYHTHTGRSTIFVYDGHPGGVGLARTGYDRIESLLDRTRRLIEGCSCEAGCPSCVQSPHCGNANEPLDPATAVAVLTLLLGDD